MKKNLMITALFLLTAFQVQAAPHKVRLSIVDFQDKSASDNDYDDGCHRHWWYQNASLGSSFKEILVEKIKTDGRYEILERENINKVYSAEHELINSEKASHPKKGLFRTAQYTLAGAVTELESCSGGGGAKVDVGSLVGLPSFGLGVERDHAHVKINLRLIDVETGEVVRSASAEGNNNRVRGDMEASALKGAHFSMGGFRHSPLGSAISEAINKATDEVLKDLPSDTEVSKNN